MEFNFLEELLSYYKEYDKKCGFGVMTKQTDRDEDDSVRYITLCCARGGKARNRTLNVANPRPTGKTECKAKINALRKNGVLRLTTVHNIHNHGLSPKKSWFFRCNRKVSDAVKRVLDTNDMAGIRANKRYESLVVGASGFENLPFLEKDCLIILTNQDIYDLAQVVPEHSDNREMKNAIAIVFPNTQHRFCLWHILKKVPEKLGSYGSYKTGMKNALMKCVYDSQHVYEFEKCWDELLTTYNLHENAWLHSLYVEREHWVPTFLKEWFWAGMSTTQ
ncbi:protein FAR1-RELATED SEQUENCE 4-like [Carya illinoinensis]|uniref:protein FAR1-RELATED SEQUENCE 4-like n=1 Tax=Carya illinoinensis TaxID=32201 RepID=UPI001C7219C1|nr:protein FAR1-RELATED SEQUENCE 4-like [Carya illinoinensis]